VQGDHPATQKGTRPLGVGVSLGRQFLWRHMETGRDAFGVSTRQGKSDNFMREIRVPGDGTSTTGLRIINVSADNDHLQLPLGWLRFFHSVCHQQRQGRPGQQRPAAELFHAPH